MHGYILTDPCSVLTRREPPTAPALFSTERELFYESAVPIPHWEVLRREKEITLERLLTYMQGLYSCQQTPRLSLCWHIYSELFDLAGSVRPSCSTVLQLDWRRAESNAVATSVATATITTTTTTTTAATATTTATATAAASISSHIRPPVLPPLPPLSIPPPPFSYSPLHPSPLFVSPPPSCSYASSTPPPPPLGEEAMRYVQRGTRQGSTPPLEEFGLDTPHRHNATDTQL